MNSIKTLLAALAVSAMSNGAAAFDAASLAEIGSVCLETGLRGCRVMAAGFINLDNGPNDGEPFIA